MSIFCDVCGKHLTIEVDTGNSFTITAVSIDVIPDETTKTILHPYEPKTYHICFPCYLKALGVPVPSE